MNNNISYPYMEKERRRGNIAMEYHGVHDVTTLVVRSDIAHSYCESTGAIFALQHCL